MLPRELNGSSDRIQSFGTYDGATPAQQGGGIGQLDRLVCTPKTGNHANHNIRQDNQRCIRKESPFDNCQYTGLVISIGFNILVDLRHPCDEFINGIG